MYVCMYVCMQRYYDILEEKIELFWEGALVGVTIVPACNPWKILQTWTFSTLEYYLSGAWKRLISKDMVMKSYDDSKLLLRENKQ